MMNGALSSAAHLGAVALKTCKARSATAIAQNAASRHRPSRLYGQW